MGGVVSLIRQRVPGEGVYVWSRSVSSPLHTAVLRDSSLDTYAVPSGIARGEGGGA